MRPRTAHRRTRQGGVAAWFATIAIVALALPVAAGAADSVYWTNTGGGSVEVGNLDGSGTPTNLFTGETAPGVEGISIDPAAGKLYWANAADGTVQVGNINGSGTAASLFTGEAAPGGVAVDPGTDRIYWSDFGSNKIRVGSLDGSGAADLLPGGPSPYGVAIDPAAGKAYWASEGLTASTGAIWAGNLDGSGSPQELFTSENFPQGVAVDPAAGKIYWANAGDGTIQVGNLDGSGAATHLFTGQGNADTVAIDPAANKIYWVIPGQARIAVGNLDGSGSPHSLFTGLEGPRFLALLRSPVGAGPPAVSGGGEVGQQLSCSQGGWVSDLLPALLYRAPRSFSYQWLKDGGEIGGATSATYTPSEPGSYSCRVTASNQAGSTAQTSAAEQVAAAPSPTPTPGGKKPSQAFGKAIGLGNAVVRGRRALLRLRCPGVNPCKGTAKLIYRRRVRRVIRRRGHRKTVKRFRRLLIGQASFYLQPHGSRLLQIELNRRGRRLLRHAHRHRLRVRLRGGGVRYRAVLLKEARQRGHRKHRRR